MRIGDRRGLGNSISCSLLDPPEREKQKGVDRDPSMYVTYGLAWRP